MTPGGDGIHALEELITTSFTRDELERFAERLDHAAKLTAVLPGQIASRAQVAHAFVGAVLDRGLLDRKFFNLLARDRPHKGAQIEALMRQCLPEAGTQSVFGGVFFDERPDVEIPRRSRLIPVVAVLALVLGAFAWNAASRSGLTTMPETTRSNVSMPPESAASRSAVPEMPEVVNPKKAPTGIPWLRPASETTPDVPTVKDLPEMPSEATPDVPTVKDLQERPSESAPDVPTVKDLPESTLSSPDAWATPNKSEDPWARSVLAALNSVKVGAFTGTSGPMLFQFILVLCPDGTIRVRTTRATGTSELDATLIRGITALKLPKPPPKITSQFNGVCKRIPHEFTWHMTGATSTIQ